MITKTNLQEILEEENKGSRWQCTTDFIIKVDHMRTLPEGLSDNVSTDLW